MFLCLIDYECCECSLFKHVRSCLSERMQSVKAANKKRNKTDLEKLARFCTTFAMRVSVRDVCSSGYSWVRLKSDGDMMAGHRKRRKREPLMRRSAMSSRPLSAQRTLQEAKTSFSSRGKTLREENKPWRLKSFFSSL